MNADPIDDGPARDSGAGRTPGQRPSARRTSARRPAAESTALAIDVEPAPVADKDPDPVPAPVDPPTTELRGTVARPVEAPFSPAAVPPPAAPMPSNIYRARRPGVAVLLIIPAVAVGVLLVQALAVAAFGDPFDLAGILASVSALVSLPFLVAGLYGLVSGAAHGAEQYGFKVWARPPLAYLLVGLAFVAAAGLAIG